MKLLLRGDANGRVSIFTVPEVSDNQLEQIQQLDSDIPPSKMTDIQQSCFCITLLKLFVCSLSRYGFAKLQQFDGRVEVD